MGNIIGTWYINIPRSQKERCSINNVVWFQRLGYLSGYLETIRCISFLNFAVAQTRKIGCEVISHQFLAFLGGHLLEHFSIENFEPPFKDDWKYIMQPIQGLVQLSSNQKTEFNYLPFR